MLDLFCYRKYGHNEGDEPRFTQPEMYAAIDRKKTVREVYIEHLIKTGKLTTEQADEIKVQRQQELERALEDTRKNGNYNLIPASMLGLWTDYKGGSDLDVPDADTRFPRTKARRCARQADELPRLVHPAPSHPALRSRQATQGHGDRRRRRLGHRRRTSLSRAFSSRASAAGSPARMSAAAPSATGTRSSSMQRPAAGTRGSGI